MKTNLLIAAALLVAFCSGVRGQETGNISASLARMEKSIAELSARVAALEGHPKAPEPQAPAEESLDEETGKKALAEFVAAQSGGAVELVGFMKKDGQASRAGGVRSYAMSAQAGIRFLATGIWKFRPDFMDQVNFQMALPPQTRKGGGWDDFLFVSQNPGIQVKRGDAFRIDGILRFEKSEQGWHITSFQSGNVTRN